MDIVIACFRHRRFSGVSFSIMCRWFGNGEKVEKVATPRGQVEVEAALPHFVS
jgi:hypothetical protein